MFPKSLKEIQVDWPAPDHVPPELKVNLAWAMGMQPNDLVDP